MRDRIRGVALIVENPRGEILLLQEFEAKPHLGKLPGMYSIPMETSLPGEDPHRSLDRLIAEELCGFGGHVRCAPECRAVYRIVPRVWVGLYYGSVPDNRLPVASERAEVGNYGWYRLGTTAGLWLRQGAKEMLGDFRSGVVGVRRTFCAPPTITVP